MLERPDDLTSGKELLKNHRHAEAQTYLLTARQHDPLNPNIHYYLGLTYQHNAEFRAAIESFSSTIDIDPNFAKAYAKRCQAYLMLAFNPAYLMYAKQDLDKLTELNFPSYKIDLLKAEYYLKSADPKSAEACLSQANEAMRHLAKKYFNCANNLLMLGQYDYAEHDYLRLVNNPNASQAIRIYSALQLALLERIAPEEFATKFRHYAKTAPGSAEKTCIMALAYFSLEKFELAKLAIKFLFENYTMQKIPHYLHFHIATLLLDRNVTLRWSERQDLKKLKTSLKEFILRLKHPIIYINTCLQSLCHSTTLGGIFCLAQTYWWQFGYKPQFANGTRTAILKDLEAKIKPEHKELIDANTYAALENLLQLEPDYFKDYPNIRACLPAMFAQRQETVNSPPGELELTVINPDLKL